MMDNPGYGQTCQISETGQVFVFHADSNRALSCSTRSARRSRRKRLARKQKYSTVNVKSEKKKTRRIGGGMSKPPSAVGEPLPMTTGWMVRHQRMEKNVMGTLMKPTMPYTAANRARRSGSSIAWRSIR